MMNWFNWLSRLVLWLLNLGGFLCRWLSVRTNVHMRLTVCFGFEFRYSAPVLSVQTSMALLTCTHFINN